jgi:3-dehydroquinate synthase
MVIPVRGEVNYDVIVDRGALSYVGEIFSLGRKVLVVTDDGVPTRYAQQVLSAAKNGYLITLKSGEENKNFEQYKRVLEALCDNAFTRTDCVVAVGGGVVGDLAGFCAATYMRGIDFYNVPTTLLAQLDSSVGGKTAIDFMGYKNCVGAFYPPQKVLIDPDVLDTLDDRQFYSGLVEAVKMSATYDADLFGFIEKCSDARRDAQEIIERAVSIKRDVTERDPKEKGERKVLNFGHTIGHAIESIAMPKLLHGECVGLGMLAVSKGEVRERIESVLRKYSLPVSYEINESEIIDLVRHDKKASGDEVSLVTVPSIGSYEIKKVKIDRIFG